MTHPGRHQIAMLSRRKTCRPVSLLRLVTPVKPRSTRLGSATLLPSRHQRHRVVDSLSQVARPNAGRPTSGAALKNGISGSVLKVPIRPWVNGDGVSVSLFHALHLFVASVHSVAYQSNLLAGYCRSCFQRPGTQTPQPSAYLAAPNANLCRRFAWPSGILRAL